MNEFSKTGKVGQAALKAGISRKAASKYIRVGKLPSDLVQPRSWRTREDPFEDVWQEIARRLVDAPELEAKILFEDLLEREPDRFVPGQLRTLQRRIKEWRAKEGPDKLVFFPQEHRPGEAAQTDFTWATELCITIRGKVLKHMLCHFVLPYSNWEWATVCYSESMLSLKRGVQDAVFRLGRAPEYHQTDHSTAATHIPSQADKEEKPKEELGFNEDYLALMRHLGMKPRTTFVGAKEQNGDVESLNGVLKRRLLQHLLMRGSRDFRSLAEYESWLCEVLVKANAQRSKKVTEELQTMRVVRVARLSEYEDVDVRVTRESTIRVKRKTYSVPSRLVRERVRVRVFEERIEVYYGGVKQMDCERLRGDKICRINYRHVIESLVRKPGAFRLYRHREELFPSLTFRRAYDALCKSLPSRRADLEYLRILKIAAETLESGVEAALGFLLAKGELPMADCVKKLVAPKENEIPGMEVFEIDLSGYDALLESDVVVSAEVLA